MNRRGFTLVEMLIAVALIGLVFVAMNSLLFSMGELWGRGSEHRLFEMHVRNATRYLEEEVRAAVLPPAVNVAKRVAISDVRTQRGSTETLLTYTVAEGGRLCDWGDAKPLPDVVCALAVREGEGLFLLWHSRWETKFDQDAPRETLVTPWVTSIQYDYYDADFKNWKTERNLIKDTNEPRYPQRLRLTFKYAGREIVSLVNLPTLEEGLPRL